MKPGLRPLSDPLSSDTLFVEPASSNQLQVMKILTRTRGIPSQADKFAAIFGSLAIWCPNKESASQSPSYLG